MPTSFGFCASFKEELLRGVHAFGPTVVRATTTRDTLYAALYDTSASLSPTATTVYTTAGEATGAGYTAGGKQLETTNVPRLSGIKAFWTPEGSLSWTDATLTNINAVLLYNSTQGNKAIGIYEMPVTSIVAGTFTVTAPSNTASTALIQLV